MTERTQGPDFPGLVRYMPSTYEETLMHLVQTMAYAGEKPWHGLGNKLAPQQPIEVWKQQAGMDWKIEESEVRYIVDARPKLTTPAR